MRIWPFNRREVRSGVYTDSLIAQILAQATGSETVSAAATGAVETASGIVSRAFAAAEVSAPDGIEESLTPTCLASMGRALIRRGECVLSIMVRGGTVYLVPAADWDIQGDYDPDSWRYRLTLSGPTTLNTQAAVSAASVVHLRYAVDHERPWRGVGPIQSAAMAGKLSAETVRALADESGSIMGYLLPTPKGGDDSTIGLLKTDLRNSRGRTHFVESMSTGWGAEDQRTRPTGDWMRRRIGPEPPEALVALQELATREILSACGISPGLFDSRAGAASREAFRQLLHAVITPLARIVETELRLKLDPSITLSFDRYGAADIAGRARAFQSLVGAGLPLPEAAAVSGLLVRDDD